MINTLVTAFKIAFFVGFLSFIVGLLALTTAVVGVGAKILNVPAPTMPTIPAFSLQADFGGSYTAGQGEATGSFSFSLGDSQSASQALSTPSHATHTVASMGKQGNTRLGLASNMAGGRTWFNQKGIQLPIR